MTAPAIKINGGSPGVKAALSASTSYTATLDSVAGVRTVEWSILSTDETSAVASYTLTPSGTVGQTVAFTSLGVGTAALLSVKVNTGVDTQTGNVGSTTTQANCKFYVPLANGSEVGCAGEKMESDPTFGSTALLNAGIRKTDALSSGALSRSVRVATAAALPANTRVANVLTGDVNGALAAVDGITLIAGDDLLVQTEGGGASHINNGAYRVTQVGDGGTPFILTRATDFNETPELIAGTRFYVREGATYQKTERVFVTTGATINVTALAFEPFAYAPNSVAYLTVGASSLLSAEKDISAVTSTLDFASTTVTPLSSSRTDAATAALVDVVQAQALSAGTAAAGFGPSVLMKGEVFGGGAENYGRVGFAATDLTAGSEDTKFVAQARTAGAAVATVFEASGTAINMPGIATGVAGVLAIDTVGGVTRTDASGGLDATAHVLEDATTALGANGVPIRNATTTLDFVSTARPVGFAHEAAAAGTAELVRHRRTITAAGLGLTGTGGYDSWYLPDGAGTEVEAFRLNVRWNQVVGPYAEVVLSLNSNGALTERITLGPSGAITTAGIVTGASFIGASLDRATAGALTWGGANATSIACSGLALTGVLSIDNSGGTIAVGADTTSQSFGKAATTASFPGLVSITGTCTSSSFIGAGLDTSGASTLSLGTANATALTVSRTGIVTTVAGGLTVNGAATTDVIRAQKANIGSTETVALWIENLTNSGTQQSPQAVWSAFNGGTQVNLGIQWEPQSTSRGKLVFYNGTGSTAPASSGLTYFDTQDSNLGEGWISPGFYISSSISIGFRFMNASNRGGMDLDGSANLRLKSYSAAGILLSIYSDAGSTLTSSPLSVNGSGQGYVRLIRAAPTSASNAVTFNLATSQNIEHALTENTTVSFSGAAAGMAGVLVFKNDGTGRTVTMPANGTGIEYDTAIIALTTTGIVSAVANTRTVLSYYVLSDVANRIYVYARSTSIIP